LEEKEYARLLERAGFEAIDIEPTRIYHLEDAAAFLAGSGLDTAIVSPDIDRRFMSAFVRAKKPTESVAFDSEVEAACCGADCCA
jgi:arsenite methyltransferase